MFVFGEKVVVIDSTLKSYNKVGLYVGKSAKGQAKVYLEEPIVTDKKNVIACITIAEEKLQRYAQNETDRLEQRIDELYHMRAALVKELKAIDDEAYEIEMKLMGGV